MISLSRSCTDSKLLELAVITAAFASLPICPRGLTFSWWGCYILCPRQKSAELAHSFYSGFVSGSGFMALSTVFHSTNSPDNSPLSHSAFLVLSAMCFFMKASLSPDIILCG